MLIRFNHGRWINLEMNDVCSITIVHTKIKPEDNALFIVDVKTLDDTETSDFFNTFEEAEKFVTDIVDRLNTEASNEKLV